MWTGWMNLAQGSVRDNEYNSESWDCLTLILLMWRTGRANNASKRQMGFNSALKGLNSITFFD